MDSDNSGDDGEVDIVGFIFGPRSILLHIRALTNSAPLDLR
jgi:hypothetical protein